MQMTVGSNTKGLYKTDSHTFRASAAFLTCMAGFCASARLSYALAPVVLSQTAILVGPQLFQRAYGMASAVQGAQRGLPTK